ncbi:MAG TPA: TadE family protein [Candidatus Elarobacter sp.]|nr:TadE family protein [Candidatus Elarobacter sp.]
MHRFVTRSRGQALIETALVLPLFLIVMFLVVWGLQVGVLGERVELVARYGGMVSARINPYQQYSVYAAYSAASGAPLPTSCVTPPSGLVTNGGPLAAPASPTQPFWQPSAGSTATSAICGKALENSSALSAPMLLGRTAITVEAANDTPAALVGIIGSQRRRVATLNQFESPDMATLIGCYGELQAAFEHSVDPSTDASATTIPSVIGAPAAGPLSLSCGS